MLMKVDGKKRQLSTGEELKSVQRVSRKMSAVIKYAVASRDQTLATEAVETKYNAEREGGLTLGVMAQNGERYGGRGGNRKSNVAPTFDLETIGITPHESSRWQTLAKMSDVDFSRAKFNAVKRAWNAWEKGKREDEREANPKAAGEALNNLKQIAESGRKFPVIYADPPWAFEVYSGKGKDRSADRHYDTQSLDTIKALPVAQVAEKDCALFMWCVMPELPGALAVIEAWGFKYKTAAFAWLKTTSEGKPAWGMGYWTRANIELCLLATRGAPTRLAKDVHQVILEPRQEHSRKPDEARTRIMRLVDGPYLELYARECAPGWTAWGDQMPPLVLPTESAA